MKGLLGVEAESPFRRGHSTWVRSHRLSSRLLGLHTTPSPPTTRT